MFTFEFLYVLPELFTFLSSLVFLVLGLLSFASYSGSHLPGFVKFGWGSSRTYIINLLRGSVDCFKSFMLIVVTISFLLLMLIYEFFIAADGVLEVLLYGSYDYSAFVAFGKVLVSATFFLFMVILYSYFNGGTLLKWSKFPVNFETLYLLVLMLLASIMIVSNSNFLSFYINLELQTFVLYIIVSLNRTSVMSTEAGLKYLILGAFSTGLLLFGISLFYGFTSVLNFYGSSIFFSLIESSYLNKDVLIPVFFSFLILFLSFFFKFSIFPFHSWTLDVYDGAPTPIMIFITVFGKFSILFLFIKLLLLINIGNFFFSLDVYPYLNSFFLYSGVITISIGSLGGIVQSRVKRLWGYSAITNLGFVFVALSSFSKWGYASAILYLVFYTIVNFLFFSFYANLKFKAGRFWVEALYLGQFSYFKFLSTFVYLLLCFVLLSFLSFPPLLNFIAKFYVLWSAYATLIGFNGCYIVVVLLINLISSFYYLRLYRFIATHNRFEYGYIPVFCYELRLLPYFIMLTLLLIYVMSMVFNNTFYHFILHLFQIFEI